MVENRRDLTERAFAFAVQIVNLCRLLDEKPGVARTLANQLLRSGTSIGANIEEGQSSQSICYYFVEKIGIRTLKRAKEFLSCLEKVSFKILVTNCLLPPNIL